MGQIRYLERYASCPAYTNTRTEYFPVGDLAFVRMLEELEKAERYIFLEYFILQEGGVLERHPGHPGAEGRRRGGGAADL